jgi:beta-galactosidase
MQRAGAGGTRQSGTFQANHILSAAALMLCAFAVGASAQTAPYAPPVSPRAKLNFDLNWKFIREDVTGAEAPGFDDSTWTSVSTPHSYNDVDSFRMIISHSGGDRGTYKGLAWYRKHFKLPAKLAGNKIFLEFEGMRQAGDIYLNGKQVGLYENGVTAYGVDISDTVHFGTQENVLAVKVDNSGGYKERSSDTPFEWNSNDFNPNHGGINRHVWLHVTGKIYQTLPLFYGLENSGVYVHAGNFNIAGKSADVTVESEVRNASGDRATVGLAAVIVDQKGQVRAKFEGEPVDMVDGEKTVLTATGALKAARFWSPDDPYLYDVYTILTVDGKTVDADKVVTGFRKTEFKGGAGTGGVYINGKFVYLKGFAQRSSNEWAGLGGAYPDWLHDYQAQMIRDNHANYMRWMHIAPQKVDSDTADRFGIVQICPAGDKERDAVGRQWDQRLEAMRDTIIYFRNSPSILFWEAGNTVVTVEHLQQMIALRKQWDPDGGRVMGARGNDNVDLNTATTPIAEYYGIMIGQDPHTDALATPTAMFRAYSAQRRDRAPLIETEDFREEGARRFWDEFSPPYFGFKKGPNDTWQFNSENFALASVQRYAAYWNNRISNPDPAHSKWSGYASIYFTDEDADGRQDSSEVSRVSGKVDAVRLPKQIYFAHRVIQNERPDIHILGHWSYPAGPDAKKTVKTIYVIANTQTVELIVNGVSAGINAHAQSVELPAGGRAGGISTQPASEYIFAFPNVEFAPGSLKAIGRNDGKPVAQMELTTAGPPAQIKLTPTVGPLGLQADGEDAALIDVEVVDSKGQRCPTDDDRVDFKVTGPAVWRGGYNSGKTDSTNNLYLNTECGINRVSLRSTFSAGAITVTASRPGLKSAEIKIVSKPVQIVDGLATFVQQHLRGPAE